MNPIETIVEKTVGDVLYSTDKSRLDIGYIHQFLNHSYWAKSIPVALLETSLQNSLCIGIYFRQQQVGFARLITDGATFAWLADVFVDERVRGRGISKNLMEFILSFDFVPGLRRFMLATLDAHGLYARYEFKQPERPDRLMEILKPNVYQHHEQQN